MKRIIFCLLLLSGITAYGYGQIGVDFQFSNLPFIGVNYEIKERFRPELRFGTDAFLEDVSLEAIVTYDILNKSEYEFYAGLGGRINAYPGIVVPIGFNFYPFEKRNFGFVMEVTPIIGEDGVLRGSLGIRHQFRQEK